MSSKREKSLGDYQNEEAPLPLINHPDTNIYENGIVSEGTSLINKVYSSSQIRDVGAKSVVFENCDFSYSVMVRAYFRNAEFLNCQFVGCHFRQCNFRGAKFSRCDFSYSSFSETQISHTDIFNQLPPRPNVRKVLAQSLRKNAESIGDTDVDWNAVGVSRREILMLLDKVAHVCQSVADQSRGVFDTATFDEENVRTALHELHDALQRMRAVQ